MSISKLFYFAKNTDATASIRGYKYQELKTLELWIKNKIDEKQEIIYCDYEEDIFHKSLEDYKSTFRQLKLYSSNFSFASEELQKSLFHFLMLFSKGDYLNDEITFIFETNADVARKYLDNHANELREWVESNSVTEELMPKLVSILKNIFANIINKFDLTTERLKESKDYFESIPDSVYQEFISRIKWKFNARSTSVELEVIDNSIIEMLQSISSPIGPKDVNILYAIRLKEVTNASIQSDPLKRGLTIDKFDEAILKLGDNEDGWYLQNFNEWKNQESIEIENFHPGWFFEILHCSEFCRRNKYVENHSELWNSLIEKLINTADIPERFLRRGIYELTFSILKPHNIPNNEDHINHLKKEILLYFETVKNHKTTYDLEKAKNLLSIIISANNLGLFEISKEELDNLTENYTTILKNEIALETTPTLRKCILMECLGFHLITNSFSERKELDFKPSLAIFHDLLEMEKEVPSYNLSDLSKSLNQMITIAIEGKLENSIRPLEEFNSQIAKLVITRDGEIAFAKTNVQTGVTYLRSNTLSGLIKSIDKFHTAKEIYQQQDTTEGYILCLLNISQFYSLLNLNFAAKYYSLCAYYMSSLVSNPLINKRISDSLSLLLNAEFKQGSWLSYLLVFPKYVNCLKAFNYQEYSNLEKLSTQKTISEYMVTIVAMKEISNDFHGFCEFEKDKGQNLLDTALQEPIDKIKRQISDNGLEEYLLHGIDGNLINDCGEIRYLEFSVFGINWKFEFENTYSVTALAEEFISVLQIYLGEILLNEKDLHLIQSEIHVEIKLTQSPKAPVRKPNNKKIEWIIYLSESTSQDPDEINKNYANLGAILFLILSEISLLPRPEFDAIQMDLFQKQGLVSKSLTANSYQHIFRKLTNPEEFNSQQRNKFSKHLLINRVEEKIPPNTSTSDKFDKNKSLGKIQTRYEKCQNALSRSLPIYLEDENFKDHIRDLQKAGYKDWLILLAITNKVISLKANMILREQKFASEDEYVTELKKLQMQMMQSDTESDNIFVPIKHIFEKNAEFFMGVTVMGILVSVNLENRARTPVFESVYKLLNEKFNFSDYDIPELSPFQFES